MTTSTMMHTYLVDYQEKGITDVLHRVVKAHSKKEAKYKLKLTLDPEWKRGITVKRVRLMDKALAS